MTAQGTASSRGTQRPIQIWKGTLLGRDVMWRLASSSHTAANTTERKSIVTLSMIRYLHSLRVGTASFVVTSSIVSLRGAIPNQTPGSNTTERAHASGELRISFTSSHPSERNYESRSATPEDRARSKRASEDEAENVAYFEKLRLQWPGSPVQILAPLLENVGEKSRISWGVRGASGPG
ncbi:hypothetical protein BJV78DRAFT_1153682 [Lactifluus subvellereus]|nr:hypothetical protein BJV78DRAFT_1153682 [Lactifluus subvellereus]